MEKHTEQLTFHCTPTEYQYIKRAIRKTIGPEGKPISNSSFLRIAAMEKSVMVLGGGNDE